MRVYTPLGPVIKLVCTLVGEDRTQSERRLTVNQAAEVLGISSEAVRARVRRDQLRSEKVGSTIYVYLPTEFVHDQTDSDSDQTQSEHDQTEDQAALLLLVEVLRQELGEAHRSNSELRRLLAASLERIPPQLEPGEAPSEPRESPVTALEDRGDGEVPPEHEKRSWWQRWFGG
jgi:hypothetical protein